MKPLRFCHITTFYPPYNFGGDGIGIQRLVEALLARGHHNTVILDADAYAMLSGGKRPELPEPRENLEVHALASRMGVVSELLTQQIGRPVVHASRIRRILDEGNFDVINFHNVSLVGGPGVFELGDSLKITMAHEHWLVCASHVLWRNGVERCDEKNCMRCVIAHRRPPQLWRYTGLIDRAAKHVDQFIAMSEFSRAKHAEFGFKEEMEVLPYFLPNLTETELAESQPGSITSERPQERPYFLFVGRLEKIKGLDDVIPIFRDFPEAQFLIAGDGDYAETLKQLASKLGVDGEVGRSELSGRVRFLGRITPMELRNYYAHAVALIVPSVCFETFGIILIEAFRQRTPVIARRLGPFPEIVERAGGGELFETSQELEECMRRMLDPEHRDKLAVSAQLAFTEHWCESVVLPRYLELVGGVAERTNRTELAGRLRDFARTARG
ncbi:MAG: glycosyltransferase involved in cell wall biosynthesis [Planctomycetota bacterium]|jgi:glycosyltransferase involved in cell wall biosynthesis